VVGLVVLEMVPLVVVELEPRHDRCCVGLIGRGMVVDMVLVVVVVGVEGLCGG